MILCRKINESLRNGVEGELPPRRKRNLDDQHQWVSEITGSELVRKYVTFHFFFPVGRHSPLYTLSGLWYLSNPLFTSHTGLLQYKANCKRVCCIFLHIQCIFQDIKMLFSYLYSYLNHSLTATPKCRWSEISWLCRFRGTIHVLSLKP